jgi:hypothetical protein
VECSAVLISRRLSAKYTVLEENNFSFDVKSCLYDSGIAPHTFKTGEINDGTNLFPSMICLRRLQIWCDELEISTIDIHQTRSEKPAV